MLNVVSTLELPSKHFRVAGEPSRMQDVAHCADMTCEVHGDEFLHEFTARSNPLMLLLNLSDSDSPTRLSNSTPQIRPPTWPQDLSNSRILKLILNSRQARRLSCLEDQEHFLPHFTQHVLPQCAHLPPSEMPDTSDISFTDTI